MKFLNLLLVFTLITFNSFASDAFKSSENLGDETSEILAYSVTSSSCPIVFTITDAPQACRALNKITISPPTGGVAPYSYTLDGNPVNRKFAIKTTGDYTVGVSDMYGCTVTQVISVYVVPKMKIGGFIYSQPTCNGDYDGVVVATGITGGGNSGGSVSYSYEWSDHATGYTVGYDEPLLDGVQAGRYNLEVTDNEGCVAKKRASLREPRVLTVTAGGIRPYKGAYRLNLSGRGGNKGYMYSIMNAGETVTFFGPQATRSFSGVAAGIYRGVVVDQFNCRATVLIIIGVVPRMQFEEYAKLGYIAYDEIDELIEKSTLEGNLILDTPQLNEETLTEVPFNVSVFPNPVSDNLQVEINTNEPVEADIRLINSVGKVVLTQTRYYEGSESQRLDVQKMPNGIYMLDVRTSNGERQTTQVLINK